MSAFFISGLLSLTPILTVSATTTACSLANQKADETVTVSRVYDGDTVKLRDGRKLRVIGINTPELGSTKKNTKPEAYAREASDFLRTLLNKSKTIKIRYGVQKKDHYGRLLAHIFLEDGQNISAIMLQNGMARSLHVPPNDWQFRCYDRLDKQAQHLKTGLWSSAQYQTLDVATLIPRTAYHSQFLQVSGIVSRIGDSKKNIWINMGSQFAIRINKSSLSAFKEINFKTLVGKKITARGYVVYYPNKKQFRMLVRHPIALTIN